MSAFQVWRDYLQLAQVVSELGKQQPGQEAPSPQEQEPQGEPALAQSASEEQICSFCKHNGESRGIYASHGLKDRQGRVQCPILRQYTCPQCGASGDTAHTKRFCPLTKKGYTSVYGSSRRNSAGRVRRKVSGRLESERGREGAVETLSKTFACLLPAALTLSDRYSGSSFAER
ncbi:nanos homolog 3 [Eublepharis macularius]|uniref:Nanos homolog 3 n=1 Tax=Eublepharis macularius TaxID=481883 RepID=A0AA97KPU1_EUBMA|nr:nanos homolog 3 [Eublepharis macularius]